MKMHDKKHIDKTSFKRAFSSSHVFHKPWRVCCAYFAHPNHGRANIGNHLCRMCLVTIWHQHLVPSYKLVSQKPCLVPKIRPQRYLFNDCGHIHPCRDARPVAKLGNGIVVDNLGGCGFGHHQINLAYKFAQIIKRGTIYCSQLCGFAVWQRACNVYRCGKHLVGGCWRCNIFGRCRYICNQKARSISKIFWPSRNISCDDKHSSHITFCRGIFAHSKLKS